MSLGRLSNLCTHCWYLNMNKYHIADRTTEMLGPFTKFVLLHRNK